jgi:O-methyltransferase
MSEAQSRPEPETAAALDARARYLELLKRSLIDDLGPAPLRAVLQAGGDVAIEPVPPREREDRRTGRDWPANGVTMIGLERLCGLERCIETVLADGVPGDLIETGVWRGGATIFMRAMLDIRGVADRLVWAADSFAGLPVPDEDGYPADTDDAHHTIDFLAVPLDEVKANFARYRVSTELVRFVPGWFKDTLPGLRDQRWALLRLDGDMYESTLLGLEHLYPRLSEGGYVIVDDYGALEGCRQAVEDFRAARGIDTPIERIDWTGVHWRKS